MPAWIPKRDDKSPPTDGLPLAARRLAMLTLGIVVTMSVLDSALSNIALPTIAHDLAASPAAVVWVANAYQLAVTVSLLPLASLGDRIGYRRVSMTGLVVFTVGALGASLATSLPMLIAMRVVMGLGGAGIMSVNSALVRFIYPRALLGRGLGMNTLVVATGMASGPTIAAIILSVLPWPFLFALHVPLGVVAFLLSRHTLPDTPHGAQPFDLSGAVLNALTFGLFIFALGDTGHGEAPWLVALQMFGAVVAGFFFVRRQRHLPLPMLPLDLFRLPIFSLSVGTAICSHLAQTMAFLALPFWFVAASGASQTQIGMLMTPWPLMLVVIAPIAGRLSDRHSAGLLGGLGLAVMSIGLLLVLNLAPDAGFWNVAWRMALCGAGFGFFQTPNNRTLIGSAPRERSGAASGMLSTARLLGQTTGGALLALVFGLSTGAGENIAHGASIAIGIAAGFSLLGMCISWLRLRLRAPRAR